jgi:hypothetical protein
MYFRAKTDKERKQWMEVLRIGNAELKAFVINMYPFCWTADHQSTVSCPP